MMRRLTIEARAADAGRRLDLVLAERTGCSRTASAALIKEGHARVGPRIAKPGHVVRAGERIEVELPAPREPAAKPEAIPIRIVYQDADLCVVDKPAGMATHPAPGSPRGTLVNALLAALGPLPAINGVLRPGIVHRLDKGTSGLIVVAKTEAAMRRLSAAIAKREVRREYDAIVWGAPAATSGTIEAPIGRHPTERTRFAVSAAGRAAVTHYRVRERFALHGEDVPSRAPRGRKSSSSSSSERLSLLDLRLETGRTHQIRVHCAAIGHPIVGDAAYGPGMPKLGAGRPMLHAARLRFTHPVTGKPLTFEAPWPDDFRELVERLRSGGAS